MLIIGCDLHTRYQQIAMAREATGELLVARRLEHGNGEAEAFYRGLQNLQEAERREDAMRLMTHPGIGPVPALAFVLAIGPITRFPRSRKLVSYLGLNPSEASSGGQRRLGAISKQGNTMLRWLAGRSRAPRRAQRPRTATRLSTVEIPKRTRGGQSSHRTQVGCAYVLDVA